MFELNVANITAWCLAAFFILGGLGNWRLPPKFRADYRRWGFPRGFNYVTAVMEFAAAGLLILPVTRLAGAGLGLIVMIGAITTLVRHKEWAHAAAPLVVAAICIAVGWMTL